MTSKQPKSFRLCTIFSGADDTAYTKIIRSYEALWKPTSGGSK